MSPEGAPPQPPDGSGPGALQPPMHRIMSLAVIGGAVIVALGVVLFFLLNAEDESSGTPVTFATPPANLPGAPTPVPNSGVIDPNRPEVGEPAPDFALPDARDPSVLRKLSDYRGRAVVLNWYASWCDPCQNEIPEFQHAQDSLGDRVAFIGVNYRESPAKAVGLMDDLHATYPAVLDGGAEVADHYRVGAGLPVTFFIDSGGVLRATKIGEVSPDDLEKYLGEIGLSYRSPS